MPAVRDTHYELYSTEDTTVVLPEDESRFHLIDQWLHEHGEGLYYSRRANTVEYIHALRGRPPTVVEELHHALNGPMRIAYLFSDPNTAFAFKLRWC